MSNWAVRQDDQPPSAAEPGSAGARAEPYVLVLTTWDRGDVLERVLGVLRRRAPFLTTVNVAPGEQPGVMRVTIGFQGTRAAARRAVAHLRKLVDVRSVTAIPAAATEESVLLREFALMRVACDTQTRREIVDLVRLFGARVVDVASDSVTLEISDSAARIERLLCLLRPFGIRELIRTGRMAMWRGGDQDGAGHESTGA